MRNLALVILVALAGCRAPADQSATQQARNVQRQTAEAGHTARQDETSITDQRQQQTSGSAPVATTARDVGAMSVTANAEFHDLGKHQLELEKQRQRSAARYQAMMVGVLLGVTLIAFTTSPLFRGGTAKTTARLFALGLIGVSCLIPLLIP